MDLLISQTRLPVQLNPASLPFFRQDDKTWLRRSGSLPANLTTGVSYRLLLKASAGASVVTVTRLVTLSA